MWHQIDENKKKSGILIFIMLVILMILGAGLGVLVSCYTNPVEADSISALTDSEIITLELAMLQGIFYAIVVWIILLAVSVVDGKRAILALNHAKKIPDGANRILENVVAEMSIAAGLPKPPEIYIIDCMMPNAFATGMNPKNSAIAVTTGLLTTLDRDELQAVVAHEIAHIVNRDTTYMLFAGIMLGTIVLLCDCIVRSFRGSGRSRSSSSSFRGGGAAVLIMLAILIFAMIIAPLAARLLYFSLSKKREYLADACAVQYTRYPQGLATALAKISGSVYVFRDADKVTSAMYIVHPLETIEIHKNFYSLWGDLFSTHPPTEKRIEILEKMTGADFNAYNAAFGKTFKRRKTIMKKEDLYDVKPLDIKKPNEGKQSRVDGSLVAGTVALATVGTLADIKSKEAQTKETTSRQQEEKQEIINRKRDALDTVWKSNNYIFKECSCGTKLKIPQEYIGEEISCPHCNTVIKVEADSNETA